MDRSAVPTIHTTLGNNNILILLPHGHVDRQGAPNHLIDLGTELTRHLRCYAVLNAKYKKAIADLNNLDSVKSRRKLTESFLLQIRRFKDEISGNGLLPLVLILQQGHATQDAQILFGYGQGERGNTQRRHSPTLPPSLLTKIRLAVEDQNIRTDTAPLESEFCGREASSLNQLFKQKNYLEGFYDPEVHSLLVTLSPELTKDQQTAKSTALRLSRAFKPFAQKMSLVRQIKISDIDTLSDSDLQYIFRIHNDNRYTELARESYIDELALSIKRNGLLHPLVLLQKEDGRYKILCGFRRFQAISRLHQEWVEAKIYQESDFNTEDFFNISLAENTRRRNLNPVEIGNFLDAASRTMGLNNTLLAEQFGQTLGIGTPGQKVSHSTIHKYRKINQIRERGESSEMINDIINEKLQFSVAAEILAPIKNTEDRDLLYTEIIKPLTPTRPQIKKIISLLEHSGPSLSQVIKNAKTQESLQKALESPQPVQTFMRLFRHGTSPAKEKMVSLPTKVEHLRKEYFGDKAKKTDFNLTRDKRAKHPCYSLKLRITAENYKDVLQKVNELLTQENLLEEDT
ncbi:ParB/RepB/Spo0J family partition protein [Desulfogranum japonicum]|uniref:ParB/RepB/Spo0J family partition protein n=1 Tax=Desulfogranum japonicum TaxID=231447 RepID=UPI0004281886|nr:ParB N-terminal domain-containing protein [Desulfogranum japonicum]